MIDDERPAPWIRGFVARWWANHNRSGRVRAALSQALARREPGGRGLNMACGEVHIEPGFVNVDRQGGAADVFADAHRLPFRDASFQVVVSQETVEHLAEPFAAVREMARVLRPRGTILLQAPFVIGYHPGPEDYWRFTGAGLRRLLEQSGLACEEVRPVLGPATGMHRIAVEFWAGLAARLWPRLYLPAKGLAALLFFPLRALDGWLLAGPQRDRIPGGYAALGRKPG